MGQQAKAVLARLLEFECPESCDSLVLGTSRDASTVSQQVTLGCYPKPIGSQHSGPNFPSLSEIPWKIDAVVSWATRLLWQHPQTIAPAYLYG